MVHVTTWYLHLRRLPQVHVQAIRRTNAMKKLPLLPPMKCDTACGDCCGMVPVTETEFRRVERFAKKKNITPIDQGVTCPFYQEGTCKVYEVRPLICALFGHSVRMECTRGYNTNVPEEEILRRVRSNGSPTKVLHELVPGFSEGMRAPNARSLITK